MADRERGLKEREVQGQTPSAVDTLEQGHVEADRAALDRESLREVGYAVVDQIVEHLTSLPARPVFVPYPSDLAEKRATEPLPEEGASSQEILRQFAEEVEPYPFGNGHPAFYGWVNSTPAPMGIWAEALAAALNPSCAGGNHAPVHLEWQVLRWLKALMSWPEGGMGMLVSGGSMATLTGLAVARFEKAGVDVRQEGLVGCPQPLALYCTAQTHSCVQKAVEMLGIGARALRKLPVDGRYRLRLDALRDAVKADREAGVRPIAVVASAGAVNTGAIDPLEEIAAYCREEDLWMHVDAAYGGPAILSQAYGDALKGLTLADSVAVDPHKWMYVPVEAGLALVRDAEAMRRTFSLVPSYLQNPESQVGGPRWFSEFGFQQTRGFRALKVWMVLRSLGVQGLRDAIDMDISLAQQLAALIEEHPLLELMAPQSLSVVCFRFVPAEPMESSALDALNEALLKQVQLRGRAFLTSTVLDGCFVLRVCFVNLRTTTAHLGALIQEVCAVGQALLDAASAES